jgi:hypothetical protein
MAFIPPGGKYATLGPITHSRHSYHSGTTGTAEHTTISFYTVSQDFAVTMLAYWSQGMNCALEAVKGIGLTFRANDLESLIVLVTANTTLGHFISPNTSYWI